MIVPVEESEEERSTVVISSEGGDQGEESVHLDLDSEASEAPDLPRDTTQEGATVAAVAQGEQVRRGPQGPPGGLSPEVVAACTRAHLVDMGVVPSISGRPPVSEPAPFSSFSSSCPPAAGRSSGMSWSSGRPSLPLREGARSGLLGLVAGPSRGGQFVPPPCPPPLLSLPYPLEGTPQGRPLPVERPCHPGRRRRLGRSSCGHPPRTS